MSLWGPVATAFCIGTSLTWIELCTSKYPNTGFLVNRKQPFIIYCFIYGIIAAAVFLLSASLIEKGKLKIEGLGLESPYVLAIVLGLSSKAIMQLNLYTVTVGSSHFPLGFQTIVQLFQPFLLRKIEINEFNGVRGFVKPYADKRLTDLIAVKREIKRNIPAALPKQEQVAFGKDIDKEKHVHEAMERFLRFLGRGTFLRVFG